MAEAKKKSSKKTTKKVVPKPKTRKSKKINLFDSQQVVSEQEKLKELQKDRKVIESKIKNIIDTYNSKSANDKDAERFLDRLPLESLKELQEFLSGKKKDSNLDILKLRAKLRKERNIKIEELNKLDEKISESQIDLLLAKIDCVMNKIETKKEE